MSLDLWRTKAVRCLERWAKLFQHLQLSFAALGGFGSSLQQL